VTRGARLGKLSCALGFPLAALLWVAPAASPARGQAGLETASAGVLDLPAALEGHLQIPEVWAEWQAEHALRDSLLGQRSYYRAMAARLGSEVDLLERDAQSGDPKDRASHGRLLAEGEGIRERVDRIEVELALSRERIRDVAGRLLAALDPIVSGSETPAPAEILQLRDEIRVWEGGTPLLPAVEVVIRPEDTPDVLRDKAGYLRDLADGLDHLAELLQRRMETLAREERLLHGAEELWEEASFLDEGGSWQDQGEVPLRVRIEGSLGEPLARGSSVVFSTPEGPMALTDLLTGHPDTEGQARRIRKLLHSAEQEVASQRDSVWVQAEQLEEEAVRREVP